MKKIIAMMRNNAFLHIVFAGFLIILLQACNTISHIPSDKKLFVDEDIVITGKINNYEKGKLKEELTSVIQPKANKKVLGIRLGLWARQRVENGKAKFYAKWVNKRIGEDAVYLSDVDLKATEKLMINRLNNLGYFNGTVKSQINKSKHTGSIQFSVAPKKRLQIVGYQYSPAGIEPLDSIVQAFVENKKMEVRTEPFSLSRLKEIRSELSNSLKNEGYYYFNSDYFIFVADSSTTKKPNTVQLTLTIKEKTPKAALAQYRISEINVYPHYAALDNTVNITTDTTEYKGVTFIQDNNFFYPAKMYPYLLMKEGSKYNKKEEQYTNRRLNSLRTYRYVSIRFMRDSSYEDGLGTLTSNIFLAPLKKRSFTAEIEANSKSNNFVGSVLSLEYLNRNIFRGAESFSLKGKLGYEAQFSGGQLSALNTFETGITAEYRVPRLVAPFRLQESFRYSLPKTKFRLSYDLIKRVQYFSFNSFLALYGYQWDVNAFVTHNLNPVSINYINISNRTDAFNELLQQSSYLQRSFQQQFIPGLSYNFQFNKLMLTDQRSRFLVLFNADFAGNLFGLIQSKNTNSGDKKILFGQEYAQYAKFDLDIRNYYNLGQESHLVSRLFLGYGLPYGNSESLPYSKQYFSGGPNSLRAFSIRSVGPGNFVSSSTSQTDAFFDQTGDIKIEANLEYRFPIYSYLKGALFTDVGNVWLKNGDAENNYKGEFRSNWYKQLAAGVGTGIRLDIEFVVVRLDVATPLRKLIDTGDFNWQDRFDIQDKSWRQENIIWNFAIGYPF